MPSSTDSWGIEVGSHAIKAIRLTKSKTGITLAEHEVIPHAKILTTPDVDTSDLIRAGLAQFVSRHQVGNASVVVSVPGNMAFARFAKLPPVEPKRVPDIVKFEAVQQIPFPIDQVEWDYQIFQEPDSPDVEVGIFAIMRDRVQQWLENFEAAGIPVHGVALSPLAMYNAMSYDRVLSPDETKGVVLMDVGTLSTDLVVVHGSKIWMRTLPIGGHHFTEAVAKGFKLGYSKAEKLKKEAAKSKYARQVFQAMRPVFVDLATELQKSLGYYQSIQREVQVRSLIGMGSTFRLPGLQKFIKQQLPLEVSRMDAFEKIEPAAHEEAEFAEHAPELAPAYGLALQGLEVEKVSANLLPARIVRAQVWRTKNRWNIAAAACLAAAAVLPALKVTLDESSYNTAKAQYASEIGAGVAAAQALADELSTVEKEDPRAQIDNVTAILDYREVWALVLKDIDLAMTHTMREHAEMKAGDVEKIQKVDRPNRRFIQINSMELTYLSTGVPGGESAPASGRKPKAKEGETSKPPAIEVKLTGVISFHDGPRLMNDFRAFFTSEQAQRLQRPYLFVTAKLESLTPLSTDSRRDRRPNDKPRAPTKPDPERENGVIQNLPGNNPSVPQGGDASFKARDVEDFFPSEPLLEERRNTDKSFEFTIHLELLPPDEARKIMSMTPQEFEAHLAAELEAAKATEPTEAGGGEAEQQP